MVISKLGLEQNMGINIEHMILLENRHFVFFFLCPKHP